jgi:hypothetical protein
VHFVEQAEQQMPCGMLPQKKPPALLPRAFVYNYFDRLSNRLPGAECRQSTVRLRLLWQSSCHKENKSRTGEEGGALAGKQTASA